MLNEKFLGVIKSCKAGVKVVRLDDGTKTRHGFYNVKLESSDIDYESMAKFNTSVSATLLNIQPMPFKMVNFGDQSTLNMQLNFYGEEPDEVDSRTIDESQEDYSDAAYGNVLITNLSVVITENIPTYVFILEIPMMYDGKFMLNNVKAKISFVFSEMTRECSDV